MSKSKYLDMKEELLTLVNKYYLINNEIKELNNKKNKLKENIKDEMKLENIEKARSQLYSVSLSIIVPNPKIAIKKLEEELIAIGLEKIWNRCFYMPDSYERLTVNLRKGGENIF